MIFILTLEIVFIIQIVTDSLHEINPSYTVIGSICILHYNKKKDRFHARNLFVKERNKDKREKYFSITYE